MKEYSVPLVSIQAVGMEALVKNLSRYTKAKFFITVLIPVCTVVRGPVIVTFTSYDCTTWRR